MIYAEIKKVAYHNIEGRLKHLLFQTAFYKGSLHSAQ